MNDELTWICFFIHFSLYAWCPQILHVNSAKIGSIAIYGVQALHKLTFDFGGCQNAFTGDMNFADLSGMSDPLMGNWKRKWKIYHFNFCLLSSKQQQLTNLTAAVQSSQFCSAKFSAQLKLILLSIVVTALSCFKQAVWFVWKTGFFNFLSEKKFRKQRM